MASPISRSDATKLPWMRIGALVSGSGTILDAMLAARLPIDLVVLDRPCDASAVAARHGVTAELVERTSFGSDFDRDGYTADLTRLLHDRGIELVVMAGFGTILGHHIYERFPDHVLNTHPSLLPSFPGWHAVRDALEHGVKVTGCTVHVATLQVDAGPILAQRPVEVRPEDTEETLHERIKVVERELYVQTVADVVARGHVLGPTNTNPSQEASDMRALLSVYDKAGVVELAQGLHDLGWELVSSGGTRPRSQPRVSPLSTSRTTPDRPSCLVTVS